MKKDIKVIRHGRKNGLEKLQLIFPDKTKWALVSIDYQEMALCITEHLCDNLHIVVRVDGWKLRGRTGDSEVT